MYSSAVDLYGSNSHPTGMRAMASISTPNNKKSHLSAVEVFKTLKGTSQAIERVRSLLDQIRSTDVTVLIEGDTGTGKELAARALHHEGPRRGKPFIALNCAGLTEPLIQSALFGHRKGSFTGAHCNNPGAFKEANGGTLLLDEVADLPLETQGNLLRVLQEGEISPVGTARPTKVDVRVISTTNKNLLELIEAGHFRQDLYFRLVVARIIMPPLRERYGDIPHLAHHFLDRYNRTYRKQVRRFGSKAMEALESYHWPGNIRELEHEVERAVVLAEDCQKITLSLLSPNIRALRQDQASDTQGPNGEFFAIPTSLQYDEAIDTLKRALLTHALRTSSGVKAHAAQLLGIGRTRLTKLQRRLGLIDAEV